MSDFSKAGDFSVDAEARTVRGLLMPWGETSRLSASQEPPIEFDRGTLAIPADFSVISANRHHNHYDPVGRATHIEDTDAGLVATFSIARTPEGDEVLADREAGKKWKLSAEVADIVRNGKKALSARLTGAAFVTEGAFASAALFAIDPAESTETGGGSEPKTTTEKFVDEITDEDGTKHKRTVTRVTVVDGDTTKITETTVITEPEPPAEQEPPVGNSIPNTLAAGAATDPKPLTKAAAFAIMDRIKDGSADASMVQRLTENSGPSSNAVFALNDVKLDGTGGLGPTITVPQWISELWSGVSYEQQIVPLFGHADLTSRTINGFRWVTKPKGGTWAGDKTAVPSNTPVAEPYQTKAQSFAGGHDIAREYRDFNVTGFFESYYAAMAESYAQWVDETVVLADIKAAAATSKADNPNGLAIGAGMSALIDGAANVLAAKAVPSFALVNDQLWKSIAKTPQNATLGYLSAALGLKDGQLDNFVIRPTTLLPAGNVLVGAREAATVYELAGVPIRVEAPDMVKGGIDTGVFGYAGTVIHKKDALQLITPYSA